MHSKEEKPMRFKLDYRELDANDVLKMCTSKHSYATKALAKRFLKGVNNRRREAGLDQLHYYRCPICHCYHFTKAPRRGVANGR